MKILLYCIIGCIAYYWIGALAEDVANPLDWGNSTKILVTICYTLVIIFSHKTWRT